MVDVAPVWSLFPNSYPKQSCHRIGSRIIVSCSRPAKTVISSFIIKIEKNCKIPKWIFFLNDHTNMQRWLEPGYWSRGNLVWLDGWCGPVWSLLPTPIQTIFVVRSNQESLSHLVRDMWTTKIVISQASEIEVSWDAKVFKRFAKLSFSWNDHTCPPTYVLLLDLRMLSRLEHII